MNNSITILITIFSYVINIGLIGLIIFWIIYRKKHPKPKKPDNIRFRNLKITRNILIAFIWALLILSFIFTFGQLWLYGIFLQDGGLTNLPLF